MLRPLSIFASIVMRTPLAPLVRLLLTLLRMAASSVFSLLRLLVSLASGCGNACRRSIIVALGGKVDTLEKAFTD